MFEIDPASIGLDELCFNYSMQGALELLKSLGYLIVPPNTIIQDSSGVYYHRDKECYSIANPKAREDQTTPLVKVDFTTGQCLIGAMRIPEEELPRILGVYKNSSDSKGSKILYDLLKARLSQ
jgi:hypothetical protein